FLQELGRSNAQSLVKTAGIGLRQRDGHGRRPMPPDEVTEGSVADRPHAPTSAAVAVILAVTAAGFGGDGWESNPPRTPQQRPANGFEDRVSDIRCRPPTSAPDRNRAPGFRGRSL